MRKYLFCLATLFFAVLGTPNSLLAASIITTPLDSRPVSLEYLKDLTELAGDDFFSVKKSNLDYFSPKGDGHFADSKQVRQDLAQLLSHHNNNDTTVILNTTSCLTGGLLGSRVAENYQNLEEGLAELKNTLEQYPNPRYYINLATPRNLPEDRGNTIWPFENSRRGLGYFYGKNYPDTDLGKWVNQYLSQSTPAQLIMEWSYVENKRAELGSKSLQPWEAEFHQYFTQEFMRQDRYKKYIETYQIPFQKTSELFQSLLQWQQDGIIDELVVSNDDLQLPDIISVLAANGVAVPMENNSPIKFSYARTYLATGSTSILQHMEKVLGTEKTAAAKEGLGESINFLYGMDETPQLIYARDYASRMALTADFRPTIYGETKTAADYDVFAVPALLKNNMHFVSGSATKKTGVFSLIVYDYAGANEGDILSAANQLEAAAPLGDTGLIELFSSSSLAAKEGNSLYYTLLSRAEQGGAGLTGLSCYSAWNTNANAIGLGIAHGQVYSIAKKSDLDQKQVLENHIKILARHILEDGVYTARSKQDLNQKRFQPTVDDVVEKSGALYDLLPIQRVFSAFENTNYQLNQEPYRVKGCQLVTYKFPWGRNFDCYLLIDVAVEKVEQQDSLKQFL